jgi:hypothetical protein
MTSGVPVKRVRVCKRDSTIRPIRVGSATQAFVRPGSNHHACIFEWTEGGKTRREAVYVTRIEAARRVRGREPIVRRIHPTRAEAKFVMSVCPGDMLLMANGDGADELMVVSTLVAGEEQKRIHVVRAADARRGSEKADRGLTANTFKARKVTVDPLGRIRWAND